MTSTLTPKALHDALAEAEKQQLILKKIIAAFNSRPETRDAVTEALEIKDVNRDAIYDAIQTGYDAVSEHVRRLTDVYVHGSVTMPDEHEQT